MALPTFIVIGVAKAGTTSFYRYLDQHSQIYMYRAKGTNFFGWEDARAWRWADEGDPPRLRHFYVRTFEDYEAAFANATDEIAIGEVSPQYFRSPTAARRIHEAIPDVKVIASLRNPAERAFSGFLMRTRRGERVKSADEELTLQASHVREGFYYTRLKRYFDAFPREQIKIYIFEEFKRDPTRTMANLFDFIGVDQGFVPDTAPRYNPANVPRSRFVNRLFYHPTFIKSTKAVLPSRGHALAKRVRQLNLSPPPTLSDDLRARLLNIYREDIVQLEELLERDLTVWLESG
ncbi:MAG: sulfotransferase [Actinobacteria bacterium]|nr:sulfotransferase [Actinomycetota bacterium]